MRALYQRSESKATYPILQDLKEFQIRMSTVAEALGNHTQVSRISNRTRGALSCNLTRVGFFCL